MELPEGWRNEFRVTEDDIRDLPERIEAAKQNLIANVTALIESTFDDLDLPKPGQPREDGWQRIRERYDIPHPERKDEFESDQDAASVITHYWLGDEVDAEVLERAVIGLGDIELFREAAGYAHNLTEPNSPEREYVQKATDYLFRDYRR